MSCTLVIGDIDGCYTELQMLLDKAGVTEADRIISIGECVDRGPETPEALRFFSARVHERIALQPREQARRFGQRAGTDRLATLRHLARLGKLTADVVHQVLRGMSVGSGRTPIGGSDAVAERHPRQRDAALGNVSLRCDAPIKAAWPPGRTAAAPLQ